MHLQPLGSASAQARPGSCTVDEIVERIADAVQTLVALPSAGCRPRGFGNSWRASLELHCRTSFAEVRDLSPAAISAMDEAFAWLSLLPADMARERTILLLRGAGWIWARIGREAGMSHEGARRAHLVAVRLIVRALNEARAA